MLIFKFLNQLKLAKWQLFSSDDKLITSLLDYYIILCVSLKFPLKTLNFLLYEEHAQLRMSCGQNSKKEQGGP